LSFPRISHTLKRIGHVVVVEDLGVGVTFHPNNRDLTFNMLLHKLKDYGDDVTGNDQASVNERHNLDKQLEGIYTVWNAELVNRKVSEQEELATYVLGFVKHRFRDDEGKYYAVISKENHLETLDMESEDFKAFVSRVAYDFMNDSSKKIPSNDKRDLAIRHIKDYTDERRTLYNRTAFVDGAIYFDLHNKQWQAVKIDKEGWSVVENPLIFRRINDNPKKYSAPIPKKTYDPNRAYIRELIDASTIKYEHQKLLCEVYNIVLFIEHVIHPMLVPYGAKGSGKSSIMRIIKMIADPVADYKAALDTLPTDERDRHVNIFYSHVIFFDNVTGLNYEQMDELCRWVTGAKRTFRVLHTTDERREYAGIRALGLNGVNLPVSRSDILDRCFIVEMERRQDATSTDGKKLKMVDEATFYSNLQKQLPEILGYVFDILSKALQLYETQAVDIDPGNRFAGFITWGELISRALGYPPGLFMMAWNMNEETQKLAVISNNTFADLLVQYTFRYHMEQRMIEKEPNELLKELRVFAESLGLDYHGDKGLPKNAVWLSRQIKEIETDLVIAGIIVDFGHAKERTIRLIKDESLHKMYVEAESKRRDTQKQIQQDKDKQLEITRKENAMKAFDKYCIEYNTSKVSPTTFQQHLLISVAKDAGTARMLIDKLVEEGKLKLDGDGNLVKI